ncbi:MAG: hypothetical protein A2Y93_11325 [Chloroflexi bacterium RBG_13_68_17]|nr:MAG: hypothetical protein A2Y93_11325 [Chloroflexi bacterium RBG_13_68_17]
MEPRPRILIIDDEEVVLDSCTQILEGKGFELATAMNGEQGLRLVREFHPDLAFVDLKMPGLSGFDVLNQIREHDPSLVAVVITGYSTIGSAVEAMKSGAYDFLPKPFTPDEFRVITQRGLEKRRLVLETLALRQERDLLQQHFAAIVSHELKAPLGAVQQNLYALGQELSGAFTPEQETRFERMTASIDVLLKLIHSWLRAYSTDLEAIADSFRPLSLAQVIPKAVESVEPHARRKDVKIVTSIEDGLAAVDGDEGTLVEALINLLGNAVKFSRLGGQVRVEASAADGAVQIVVIDQGIGIAAEDLPLVLKALRPGRAGPDGERGSGLGLAITRRIVEAHHGTIAVASEPGKGTTFTIHLPGSGSSRTSQATPDGTGATDP